MALFYVIDDELEAQLADPKVRSQWLVLDRHPDFTGHWVVEGFSNDYLFDLSPLIGSYRAVPDSGLGRFLEVVEQYGYTTAFFEDPTATLEAVTALDEPPAVTIQSEFANTTNGMLFYQVNGFNALKDLDYGVALWDTGTGKTVLAAALVKYHQERSQFDTCFFVVKKNNKVNTVRKLHKLAGVDAVYVRGPKAQRERVYEQIAANSGTVVVLNYEIFKSDFVHRVKHPALPKDKGKLELTKWGETFFPNRDLLFVWDEMPTKLKTRTSELYKAITKLLYRTAPPQVDHTRLRPRSMRSYMLSATPIENSPEDWFNCQRIMDGGRSYGTVTDFHNAYVARWNTFDPTKPADFHDYERMRLKTAHCLHQASKEDPRIAAVFPKAVPDTVYIDWTERQAVIYNKIQDLAEGVITEGEDVPIFSLITTLQMVCDAPEMILDSAARRAAFEEALEMWEESPVGREPKTDGSEFALTLSDQLATKLTNTDHPKIEKLRELLLERHPDEQVVLFTKANWTIMPYLESWLRGWGVSYGRYAGSESQQQAVQDAFQAGDIRVFLSSDAGSDSIDLDAGNVVIDYNLPWKWTTLTQRHNRVHRPTSNHDTVYYYTLVMEGSVEERVLQIIEKKRGYHNQLFNPTAAGIEESARLTREDLMYILTGRQGM